MVSCGIFFMGKEIAYSIDDGSTEKGNNANDYRSDNLREEASGAGIDICMNLFPG